MGTSKSGRYLNTKGSGRNVSDFALIHSSEGTFKWKLINKNGKKAKKYVLRVEVTVNTEWICSTNMELNTI